jgi:hypothetical protein
MLLRPLSRVAIIAFATLLLATTATAQDFSSVAGFETWALNLLQKLLTMFGDFLVMLLREVFAGLQTLLGQVPASVPDALPSGISATLPLAVPAASPTELIPLAPIDIKL